MPLHVPPRLLTGIALLFWGGLTGHLVFGLIAATLVEASSWVTLRWSFSKGSYVRAWHVSVMISATLALLAWLNGMRLDKIHTIFSWAPLTLLPILLAQRYGKSELIPLNTFSFFARRKMIHDIKQGYHVDPTMINIGYLYIAITLLASAVASRDDVAHFVCFSIILGVCLYFNAKRDGVRPVAWIVAFTLLVGISYLGHSPMSNAYNYYSKKFTGKMDERFTSANESRTSIGKLGQLKLSPYIFWRMQVSPETPPPALVRTATYHFYSRGSWKYTPGEYDPEGIRDEYGYISDSSLTQAVTNNDISYFNDETNDVTPNFNEDPDLRIYGEINSKVLANPIPTPHFTLGLGDLANNGSETSLECNTLGTIRIINPDFNIVSYSVWTGDHSTTEVDPPTEHDLQIPKQEIAAIQRVCRQLGLRKGMSAKYILAKLTQFFNSEFTYTTHLTTPKVDLIKRWSAIGLFLEKTQAGHCEYFATATALILRECGIPARYCIGFSVNEYNGGRDEWVMRGKHAHAWCRVWSDGEWEDADLTPPSWLAAEEINPSAWNLKIADAWKRLREDLLLWRTRDENKRITTIIIICVLGVLSLWLIWKLSRSWQRNNKNNTKGLYHSSAEIKPTALNKLEPAISRKIGRRPDGQPLSLWLKSLEKVDSNIGKILEPLIKLHSELRFNPEANQDELSEQADGLAAELKRELKNVTPLHKQSNGEGK